MQKKSSKKPNAKSNIKQKHKTNKFSNSILKSSNAGYKCCKEPCYLAIDSDILRYLICFKYGTNAKKQFENTCDSFIRKNHETLKEILKLIDEDKLRLVITRTTVAESPAFNDVRKDLFKNFLYFTDFATDEYFEKEIKIENLANTYSSSPGEKNIAMKKKYFAAMKSYVPTNDAYILAEASVEGLMFVTNNEKDFIYDIFKMKDLSEKTKKDVSYLKNDVRNCDIQTKIKNINFLSGLNFMTEKGVKAPHPISFDKLSYLLRKGALSDLRITSHENLKRYDDLSEETKAIMESGI